MRQKIEEKSVEKIEERTVQQRIEKKRWFFFLNSGCRRTLILCRFLSLSLPSSVFLSGTHIHFRGKNRLDYVTMA